MAVGKRTRVVLIWLLAAVILAACDPTGETSSDRASLSPTPPSNAKSAGAPAQCRGRIAYVGRSDGENDIFVVNADGSGLMYLTDGPDREQSPSWSPDGKRIAFVSDRTGSDEIYVMTISDGPQAGSVGLGRLTDSPEDERYPTWSPDGTCLAFVTYHDGESELYVVNVAGGEPTKLADNADWNGRPSWSAAPVSGP
jgi:Tol biopolymer transport system component